MNGKTKAIVAHITIIGWIIALIVNNSEKDELASFYIRQTLGLFIIAALSSILTFIPLFGLLSLPISIAVFILWIISLINAAGGKATPLPIVGGLFQDWFKSL